MGIDFDNPLDGEFLNDFTQAKRETIGDDLARPKAYIIGKVFPNGSTATTVTDGEYGAVWIRDPGDDPGDAIPAINLTLQAHEVSFNRPVWVKKDGKKLYIMNKAPQSADYDADYPVRPQRSSNRSQLDFALIRPTDPLSLAVYLSESLYELDHTQYRVESQTSLSFDGTLPATQKAVTIEVTPADGSLTYFHSGEFSGKTIRQAFDDGNITKKTSTEGRYIVGHVLLTAGQTEIIQTDVLEGDWYSTKTETLAGGLYDVSITSPQSGELIAYDGTLWRNDPSLNLDNFVIKIPGSDTRNRITPTGDFNALEFATTDGTLTSYMQQNGDWVTVNDGLENTRFGNRVGTPNGGFANTFYGELAGGAASGDDNVAIGWNSLNAITTGSANMALGSDVLSKTTTGFDNVGMGAFALSSNVAGNYNIAVGSSALNTMLSDKNVAIGYQGGAGNVNGSLNIYIGYKAGLNTTGSGEIYIHPGATTTPLIYGNADGGLIFYGQHPGEVSVIVQGAANQAVDTVRLGDESGGDYTAIEKDGFIRLEGAARAWDDLQISVSNVRLPAANAPTWVSYKGSQVLSFSPTQDNIIYFEAQLKHGYAIGEDIEFHIHLVYPNGNAGNTIWNFTYSWGNIGGTFPVETTVSGVSIASPTTTDYHQLAEIAATITGTGKNISSVLLCSLEREGSNGSDTYSTGIYFTSADFHIPLDGIGSRQEDSK